MVQTAHAWSVLVAAHAVAASLALVLGGANLVRRPKGNRSHRGIGWTWVGLMYFTALSSFLVQMIRPGRFSWIHALSVLTLVTLTLALWCARRGNVRGHAANMIGTYLGLWGAFIGVVAVPDRLVPEAFQSNWVGMGLLTSGLVVGGLALVGLLARVLPEPSLVEVRPLHDQPDS